ncbi:MAG TPA: citramalate synthase [Dehalococcoidia bacterium]|nr:citramalate synthase [Dehalococcoidia bacterium]
MSSKPQLYDSTLRDGSQMEGISFSVEEKLLVAQKLDELGVDFIEGGFPGSNPRDAEFFVRVPDLKLRRARIVAFGGTRRAGLRCEDDPNIQSIVRAETQAVCFVGKASAKQVREILETTPEENLAMIADSVAYMRSLGKQVFFDAEHFFDGYFNDPKYALQVLRTAVRAGAEVAVLCDTNGGMITPQLLQALEAVQRTGVPFGIHVHDDAGLAVANTLAAYQAGAVQLQGCVNGYGERCGNANLMSIIANLKLKMGVDCVADEQLARLTEVSTYIGELANVVPNPQAPYVGQSAFAHKAGYHVAAIVKDVSSYQHIDPSSVGNGKRVLVSELSGQRNIIAKLEEQGWYVPLSSAETRRLLQQVKTMESRGYQYEAAEASFELLVRRSQPDYAAPFELEDFMIVERRRHKADRDGDGSEMLAEAMAKIRVGEEIRHTAAEGNGPVNALDAAVRKALADFYPEIGRVHLLDYKVRILDGNTGTAASTRVLIESSDGEEIWRTVGCSTDIIEASWLALADSLEYWLLLHARRNGGTSTTATPARRH